ncbi:DUF349 domain-containing protein [Salegentibacter sp. F188]|uniref:DUF349 domain-containing protein n=1 Tax=Autumnicola patrickiae TaxID=3075591 RepID=A0ABU3DXE5_9FLAO|nr:DUF349 domain-containing protein [Salegentibacter sp. F188]MDT0688380.1 DUF349 domain-containing protein [Salegentibacter sp. F188]
MSQEENDKEKKNLSANTPDTSESKNSEERELKEGNRTAADEGTDENSFSEPVDNTKKEQPAKNGNSDASASAEEKSKSTAASSASEENDEDENDTADAIVQENKKEEDVTAANPTFDSDADEQAKSLEEKVNTAKPDAIKANPASEEEKLAAASKAYESEKSSESDNDSADAYVQENKKQENISATNSSSEDNGEDEDLDSDVAGAIVNENRKASKSHQEDVDNAVAEDSEDESAVERHNIEKKDYHSMSKEQLTDELEALLKKEKVQAIKDHVTEIRAEFNAKFDEELEEKKEEFLADGGNIIDFHYSTPLKKRFNDLYFDYKEKRNRYYKQLKQDLNHNLNKRLEIIEELKGLIDVEENINTTYKHFKDLQDRWKLAGAIPRDRYNNVWNTYHHHVENFYDFLHLNREFRDLDFKHNLEQKLKVIDRAEELAEEEDVNRAFRELQMLHKMWKEELGPVGKEYREDIWNRFSDATKKIHDKRQQYFNNLDQVFEKNWEKKQEIINKIKEIAEENYNNHNKWQQKIKDLEALREEFFKAGKVPRAKNEETWSEFKQSVRKFNRNKNNFYKDLKKQQYDNLEKKRELIKIADDNKDSDDFKTVTPLMKKIQAEWKTIGHVPRKDSDKVWKQFKAACNHYFDRLHASKNEENKEETEAFDQKKEILDKLKALELSGNKEDDLAKIKEQIAAWKNVGRVPYSKRFIEGKFNKVLDQLFGKLDVNRTKAEMMKYENKIQALNDADDEKKIRNEHYFLTKKIEETTAEIRQLENNLQFFSNVDEDNPLVQDVHKNINDHKAQLEVWKKKLKKVKSLY